MDRSPDGLHPDDYSRKKNQDFVHGFTRGVLSKWSPRNDESVHTVEGFDREALEYARRHPRDPDCAKLLHEYGQKVLALEAEQLAKGIHPSQLSSRIQFIEPKATDW